ncbi:Bacteriophage phiKZ, Orf197 [uncultured Caudovirales phage]|uniref:Bacteriophage phiKZ, Orf197 n=1 Tax=uncultured Caudovirales phage TaxID=2100421 RepID=A0A6J5L986_9CAUD|nr:Bacteriophage phiKZ, Orf197 [uncultured Caudovirales phage]
MIVAFIIIFIHWIADFVLQTDWQAQNKSKSNFALLSHTSNYSLVWLLPMCLVFGKMKEGATTEWIVWTTFYFGMITFVVHTITDYFTSRLNSKLWSQGKVHYFFVSVGFDQVLHYGQLFLTYYFLINR